MNIPMSWLKEYVDIDVDLKTFANEMTMSGSAVEGVEMQGFDIEKVVVGKILEIEKHPDADKLVVTKVDVGTETLQIVTGANNISVGDLVPISIVGAKLAGGLVIKKGKLRGVESNGMMCSVEELGSNRNVFPEAPEHGIYIFQEEVPIGADVVELLNIREEIVEFELTSNRTDCYSIIGMAREAAATFNKTLKFPEIKVNETAAGNINEMISVEIQNSELCPRYIARVVKNVKIEPSPLWMRHRLAAAGIRPINNIVDITNYVMLELGQPMHAFDIDSIKDRKIIIRNAKNGEKFTTLDKAERILDNSMLVIADSEKAVAIAGVMGGENSKVSENAEAILFESANFHGSNVRVTSKKVGLRTDASGKFEKGLDPNLAEIAVNRAVQLVEMLNCGEVVSGMVDAYPNKRVENKVKFTAEAVNKLLGTDISFDDMVKYLKRVEIEVIDNTAIIPTFRPDVECGADIAEEVGRLFGYNNIKTTLATGTPTVGKKTYTQQIEDLIKNTMVSLGMNEAVNFSFESPKVFDKLLIPENSDLRKVVKINNPLGEDFSVMRTTTLNGMLQSLSTNYNRRNTEASLFEVAKVYMPKALPLTELPLEKKVLTLAMYGKVDFYDIKGYLEILFRTLGITEEYSPNKTMKHMHPGRTATVTVNNKDLGYIGQIHPTVANNYSIDKEVYIAVIDLDLLFELADLGKQFKQLPKFPSVQRDIAMLIKDDVIVKDIENVIKANGGQYLENVDLFDIYTGKQIEEGFKSVAYNISFRAIDKTLTEEDISGSMKKILTKLESELNAKLRDK